ncbi:MAG: hypothetical protein AB7Q37_00610 [Pyrinomonadaceae bacterium]
MKKFLLTGVMCTLVAFFLSFLIHGVILESYYSALAVRGVFRTPDESSNYFYLMIIAHVLIGFAFAWIYIRGHEPGKPWYLQGIRYAVAIICLTAVPWYTIYFVVQPLPSALVGQQIIYDSVAVIINGLVAAFINRDRAAIPAD